MSYATFTEADVKSNGKIQLGMAMTSFRFVYIRRLEANFTLKNDGLTLSLLGTGLIHATWLYYRLR